MTAFWRALRETLRFFRDDPVGYLRVLGAYVSGGRKAAADEYERRNRPE